jgi:hypothetical protein
MEEPEISRGLTAGFTSTIFGRHWELVPYLTML